MNSVLLVSAKGLDIRRQAAKELVSPSGGALDAVTVLRELLNRLTAKRCLVNTYRQHHRPCQAVAQCVARLLSKRSRWSHEARLGGRAFVALLAVFAVRTLAAAQPQTQTAPKSASQPAPRTQAPAPQSPTVPLPSEPGVYAVIYTSMGNIVCRLFEKDAPKTVANFEGLATGTKVWTDPKTGKPKHTPLYSGTNFHRVIPQFMIQGGDPAGDGTGSPGYQFDDEISPAHHFDHPGVLAMANSGPNTNGCQFFITVAPAPHLDGNYSIFGEVVSGQDVADAISQVPRNANDKPNTPVKILRIAIRKVNPINPASNGII